MKSKRKISPAKQEGRRRWSLVMQQLRRDGITQERMSRSLSDEHDEVSVSAVQKWSNGVNLPDFVSVGRLLAWQGRDGWLTLWALGLNSRQMSALADGIGELLKNPEKALHVGKGDPREEKAISKLRAKLKASDVPVQKQEKEIMRGLVDLGESQAEIARRRGISRQRVAQIVNEPSPKSNRISGRK